MNEDSGNINAGNLGDMDMGSQSDEQSSDNFVAASEGEISESFSRSIYDMSSHHKRNRGSVFLENFTQLNRD